MIMTKKKVLLGDLCYSDTGSVAGSILAAYRVSSQIWKNRVTKLGKRLAFAEEEVRDLVPASEEDSLAFIGYPSKERRVGPKSVQQCL